jgi:hypothetical protein
MMIILFVVYTVLFAALASLPLWAGEELRPARPAPHHTEE